MTHNADNNATENFLLSIEKNDLDTARKYLGEISWSDITTWKTLYHHWVQAPAEVGHFIYQLTPDKMFAAGDEYSQYSNKQDKEYHKIYGEKYGRDLDHFKFSDYCDTMIECRLSRNGYIPAASIYVLRNIFQLYPEKLDNPVYMTNYFHCLIRANGDNTENMDICKLLIEKKPDNFLSLIRWSYPPNKEFLANLYPYAYGEKDKWMATLVAAGEIEKIEILRGFGVPLGDNKRAYSELFSTRDKLSCMRYVLNNIKDIRFGSDQILKTALHHDIFEIVGDILEMYPPDAYEDLKKIIAKRGYNSSIALVEKKFLLDELESNLCLKHKAKSIKI